MSYTNGSRTQTKNGSRTQTKASSVGLPAFLQGQRKINGGFYQVDQDILKAITELKDAVEGALKIDLASVNAALQQANSISKKIPGVNPPGCEPW